MMLSLLIWCLVAPSLRGGDDDSRVVAGRLRARVARMLATPVFFGLGIWLAGCLLGSVVLLLGLIQHRPLFALLGPGAAVAGAVLGAASLQVIGFRERVWLEALGLPPDWRGPWLAGELAEHLGWNRRAIPVQIPHSAAWKSPVVAQGSGTRRLGLASPKLLLPRVEAAQITAADRWFPTAVDATELARVDRLTWNDESTPVAEWLEQRAVETIPCLRPLVPRIRGVGYLDAGPVVTPPRAEG